MQKKNRAKNNGERPPTRSWKEDYGSAFPNSRKVFVEGRYDVRVPMREIELSGGESPLRVNDTSGALGIDPRRGLPRLRAGWIRDRGEVGPGEPRHTPGDSDTAVSMPEALRNRPLVSKGGPVTQMHYARRGEITPEMEFVAIREGMDPAFVRSELAAAPSSRPTSIIQSWSRWSSGGRSG